MAEFLYDHECSTYDLHGREISYEKLLSIEVPKCSVMDCMFFDTPSVGPIGMRRRPYEKSLLGKVEKKNAVFKFDRVRLTSRTIEACEHLLKQELGQASG